MNNKKNAQLYILVVLLTIIGVGLTLYKHFSLGFVFTPGGTETVWQIQGRIQFDADIVLDKNRGPLLLELNARPGLAIQIANGAGMQSRLTLLESQLDLKRMSELRVDYSMSRFG